MKKRSEKAIQKDKQEITSIKVPKQLVERINKLIRIEQGIQDKNLTQADIISMLLDAYDRNEMNKDERV